MSLANIVRALTSGQAIRITYLGGCIFCEAQRRVTVPMGHDSGTFLDWLDDEATKRCPCLGDVLWQRKQHRMMTHPGYRRKRIELALSELPNDPSYRDRRKAMTEALSAH